MDNYYGLNSNYNDRLDIWIAQIKQQNNNTVIYSLSDINYSARFDEMIQTFTTSNACFAMCALDKPTYTYFSSRNIPTILLDKAEDNFNHLVCISKFLLTKVLLQNQFNVIMTEADIFWKVDITTVFNSNAELTVSQHTYSKEVNIGCYRVISNENTINFFINLMDWIYDPAYSYTEDVYRKIYLKKLPHLGVDQKIFDYALRDCNDGFLRAVGYNFKQESLEKLKTVKLDWDYLSYNILMHWPIKYPNNYMGVHIWSGYNKIPSEQIKYAHSYKWYCNYFSMQSYTNSPYRNIPNELLAQYTMNNRIPVFSWWRDDRENTNIVWNDALINDFCNRFTPDNIRNNAEGQTDYGHEVCVNLLQSFEEYNIKNQHVAVVGSLTPWIEAILINLNNTVTTIEYNVPESSYDKITCKDYFEYFEKNTNTFDSVVSFSSIEHSGLGRYGDPLDPDGDLKTMQVIHKNLKKDGLLIWGSPVGNDSLAWNAHRVYGPVRLPKLFENFKEMKWYGYSKERLFNQRPAKNSYQPVVVLKRI